MGTATWTDPLTSMSFYCDFAGQAQGYFRECSGISSEMEMIEQREVGKNGVMVVKKVPGAVKCGDITLRHGMTDAMDLWEWHQKVKDGKLEDARCEGSVVMYSQNHEEMARWNLTNCWPVSVKGPPLNATTNEIAVEEIVIAAESIERVK
jgi:phage tail-like protein